MKKNIFQLFTILVLAGLSFSGFTQDRRTLETKVADLLAQMPTNDLTQRDNAMQELYAMGTEGYQKLAEMLVPLGTGDDTAIRFALNSFSRYASQFGKTDERAFAEANLLDALKKQKDTEVLTFLINQLNLVASDVSIPILAEYLTDEDLCEPATQALLSIDHQIDGKVFFSAFPQAGKKNKETLIRALGRLQCKGTIALMSPYIDDEDVSMRKIVLAALANIGAPESYDKLLTAAQKVDFAYEATNAAEAFLRYANRLGEQNELDLMKKACNEVFDSNTAPELLHNYSEALKIYSNYLGYEATPLLLAAVDNPDKAFRYSVLNMAEKTGGIADTRKWINKGENATPEVKADIISMLGRRGCALATAFVQKNMSADDENVSAEAVIAFGEIQGKAGVPVLADHLASGKNLETSKAVLTTLLDKDHLFEIYPQLEKTSGAEKAAIIDLIAAKSGSQYFNDILAATKSNDPAVKASAFKALKNVSLYENVDELLHLLATVSDESEIDETQQAIIAATQGVTAEQEVDGKVLLALRTSDKKSRLFPILPEIGGPLALETITEYYNRSKGDEKVAALDALASWKEYSASVPLFDICENSKGDTQQEAFTNFVRLVREANIPDDQKLLQYRKIMPLAANTDNQEAVISAIGQLKTFLSLIYLEQYFDNGDLASTTAYSVMRIAMPGADDISGMSGDIVRRILEKAKNTLTGEDSQYDRINIQKYLDEMPREKGFVPMFNGKNLDGWQGMLLDGNPIEIAKLSDLEKANLQKEADQKMHENWSVKDGQIIFNGNGANLVSAKRYKDFEMIVDWKITKKGDSGIYLRGAPQVQIWDTSRVEVGAQVGSGGLYNNNEDNIRDPLLVADNPIDEWNTFRITMIGENVTVYLNGELVVDNVKMDNYWDRSIPIFSEGTIELQAHGNELAFRDIYVRDINTKEIGLTQGEIDDGFVSLFNGKNLDGWQGNTTDYYVEDGLLVVNPKNGGHGNLYTDKEYSNFIFRFEFKLTPGANNGLGIRAPLEGDAAYVGMELQILDNTAPIYANLHEYQYHGSVYGVIPAKRGYLNPIGDWNYEEVVVQGTHVKVILNGTTIVDGDIAEASKNGTMDGNDHPGLKRTKGYIGFLGHGSELWFRNIRIKELSN